MEDYRLHGLNIRSEVPLEAPAGEGPPDVLVRWGPVVSGDQAPAGVLLASLHPDVPLYDFWRTATGYLLRFHEYVDVVIDAHLQQVEIRLHQGVDEGWARMFLEGSALAFVVFQRGHCVLHASAVEQDGVIVAMVAASGVGKTTLAARLCAEGARLVTDDVLRVDFPAVGAPYVHPGSVELRLRLSESEATALLPHAARRRTADGRTAVRLPGLVAPGPLRAVLLPRIVDEGELQVVDLPDQGALLGLVGSPRTAWVAKREQARQVRDLARLARSVPVLGVLVPRGGSGPALVGRLWRQVDQLAPLAA